MNVIYISKIAVTIFFGLILGFLSSIPVGAVQLEVIKKTINGHTKPAIATALGSATSDLLYGLLTLFGFGHFLLHKDFQIFIYHMGIVFLLYLIYKSYQEREYMLHKEKRIKYNKRLSFLTGFTIAVTNPGMIIWWFIGFRLYADLNLFDVITPFIKLCFVISGAIGLALYLILEAAILHRLKRSFSEKFLYRANVFLMIVLGVLVLYFAYKLVLIIFNLKNMPSF